MDWTLTNIPMLSSVAGAAAFLMLTALLISGFRGSRISLALIAASGVTTVWFALHVYYYQQTTNIYPITVLQLGEIVRDGVWFVFLSILLSRCLVSVGGTFPRAQIGAVLLLIVLLAGYIVAIRYGPLGIANYDPGNSILLTGFLLLAVIGLVLTEQLFRNTHGDRRWAVLYLCIGIAALFAYDFCLYADALLFNRINEDFWAARGAINALVVPLIAVSAARNREWDTNLFVSRRVVFHSGSIILAGCYLLLMAAAGYYLRAYGGTWGGALQLVFTFAAMVALVVLLFSSQVRARAKGFITKHFYRNKYEYGEEWLKFTRRLSESGAELSAMKVNIIAAVADIVHSRGGILWERDGDGRFVASANWNMPLPRTRTVTAADPGLQRVAREEWVVDLISYAAERSINDAASIPNLFTDIADAWLLVPVCHGEDMVAFIVLKRSEQPMALTTEDIDLLRTVGRQAASYVVLLNTTDRLTEARQFETYNKLSAFLVHDLKNVIAQLGLIQQNAQKHRHNPAFVEDAFNTIDAAVTRMNHMLTGLRHTQHDGRAMEPVNLNQLLARGVQERVAELPVPTLTVPANDDIYVIGDAEQLRNVIVHLVQNAQEATPAAGEVEVSLARQDAHAVISVRDSGRGMDQEFIEKRLFRPFDSTKGNAGMGIGAYESRHVVHSHGGRLEVQSEPRRGTTFTILLPIQEESNMAATA